MFLFKFHKFSVVIVYKFSFKNFHIYTLTNDYHIAYNITIINSALHKEVNMKSKTKRELDNNSIISLCSKAFHDKTLVDIKIAPLTQGCYNSAYLIRFRDDFKTVLKIAPSPTVKSMSYEENIMAAEVFAMKLVKENTNIPVPNIYFYDSEKDLIDSEYFFMEFLEGEPLSDAKVSMKPEEIMAIQIEVGSYVKQMSLFTNKNFGYCSQKSKQRDTWKDFFENAIHLLIRDAIDIKAELGTDISAIKQALSYNINLLDEITTARFVHWDLWEGNIFINNGKITGIIDFERCMWADPLIENIFMEIDNSEHYKKGYGIVNFTQKEISRRHLYNLYAMLLMCVEPYFRGYTGNWLHNFAKENLALETKWLINNSI